MERPRRGGRRYALIPHRLEKHRLRLPPPQPGRVSPSVDLRGMMPPVYEQGNLGSCTAQALCAAVFALTRFDASRMFLYYNERVRDGDVAEDAGSTISTGIETLEKVGVCSEANWPYSRAFDERPSEACFQEARRHLLLRAHNVPGTLQDLRAVLSSGRPIALGIMAYSGMESREAFDTGRVHMPGPGEQPLGGHAVLCVGYDQDGWIMRNSWGSQWGDRGYFHLPTEYLLTPSHLAADFWVATAFSLASPSRPPAQPDESEPSTKEV